MKKLLTGILLSASLLSLSACGSDSENTEDTSNAEHSSSEVAKESKKAETKESKKKETKNPAVSAAEKLNKEGETTDLKAGKWTVGKDIKPGHYKLTAPSGSGNVSGNTKYSLNIILSATPESDGMSLTQFETYLSDGEEIEISGLPSVHFEAIREGKNIDGGELDAGDYVVGLDIKPGRYKIQAVSGSGNVSTDDGELNEVIGTDESDGMSIKETTQNLKEGTVLSDTAEKISLTKQ